VKIRSSSKDVHIQPATVDDVRLITTAIDATGGNGFYKAIFGSYNLPSMIDLSYYSLVANIDGHVTNKEENIPFIEGFVSVNDDIPLIPEPRAFETVINGLKTLLPVNVSLFILNFF
jgi:hypothetical protein